MTDARLRALLIDDERLILEAYDEIFTGWGYEVTAVETVEEGLVLLASGHVYDVVVSDNSTPGQYEGVYLAQQFGNNEDGMRVVIISAEELANRLSETGAGFLRKPVEVEQIKKAIEMPVKRSMQQDAPGQGFLFGEPGF